MNNKYIDTQKIDYKIKNRERGEISYYSIDQVADLLNENVGNIKYYTNIFDDLLKIEIVDKDLRYTNKDIDKLEFLIKLKNRGMSLKEIEDYYIKLPLSDDEIQHSENNLLSVGELIDLIKEEQKIQLDNFKLQLINDIKNDSLLYLKNISSTIIEVQNNSINEFKQDLVKELKKYIDFKFDIVNEVNEDLNKKFTDNITKLISKKVDNKNDELKLNLQSDFSTFHKSFLTNNECLIKEVKDFKRVIENAYNTRCEIEMDNINTTGFLSKLIRIIKAK